MKLSKHNVASIILSGLIAVILILVVAYIGDVVFHLAQAEMFKADNPGHILGAAPSMNKHADGGEPRGQDVSASFVEKAYASGSDASVNSSPASGTPKHVWETSGTYDISHPESFEHEWNLLEFDIMGKDNPHHWYIAHNYTLYGHMIAVLDAGDIVEVNGVKWCIEDRYIVKYPASSSVVFGAIGHDKTIFQTCVSGWSDEMWIITAVRAG